MLTSNLIICADDFGQNEAISQGIYELLNLNHLNAVSCMVNGKAWDTYATKLAGFKNNIDIGLHLNFTHGRSLTNRPFHSLFKLIIQCYGFYPISKTWIEKEIKAQILKFKDDMGFWPMFIDGHQHVHQLPVIREALINVVHELEFTPWFRSTYHSLNQALRKKGSWKKWVLFILGGEQFYQLVTANGFKTNINFSGDYRFDISQNYREQFLNSLQAIDGKGLIMCHPGLESNDFSDSIRDSRVQEFNYLKSTQYYNDMNDWS
jgi:hypothetical protein